jgi:hypothetical protein
MCVLHVSEECRNVTFVPNPLKGYLGHWRDMYIYMHMCVCVCVCVCAHACLLLFACWPIHGACMDPINMQSCNHNLNRIMAHENVSVAECLCTARLPANWLMSWPCREVGMLCAVLCPGGPRPRLNCVGCVDTASQAEAWRWVGWTRLKLFNWICPNLWRNRLEALTADLKGGGGWYDPHSGQSKVRLFSSSILTDKIVLVVQNC